KAFAAGERGSDPAQRPRACARNRDDTRAFLKIVHAERRGEARTSGGRQNVVRAGAIIADRLGAVVPDKNGSGIPDTREKGLGVGDSKLEMLGRDAVGSLAGLCEITYKDERTSLPQSLGNDVASRLRRELPLDACRDGFDQRLIGCQQYRSRGLV